MDEDKCYDVMMAERTALLTAKRETEDELVRTLVKLSSAALLLVPGLALASDRRIDIVENTWLVTSAAMFMLSLLSALLEQLLSSKAYDRQVGIVIEFYTRKSSIRADKVFARYVRAAQLAAFALFIVGVVSAAVGLAKEGSINGSGTAAGSTPAISSTTATES